MKNQNTNVPETPETRRRAWFEKAVELYPDYFKWPLWKRMELREAINQAVGFSL